MDKIKQMFQSHMKAYIHIFNVYVNGTKQSWEVEALDYTQAMGIVYDYIREHDLLTCYHGMSYFNIEYNGYKEKETIKVE